MTTWRLAANLSVVGASPASKSFQSITEGQVNTSFSSSHELIKETLNFTVSVSNPFQKLRTIDTHTVGPDVDEFRHDQIYFRAYRFSLNFHFGQLKDGVKKAKKSIKNDDISN